MDAQVKPYQRPFPKDWWTRKPAYSWFMVREATCVFVAIYTILTITLVWKHAQGEAAYLDFVEAIRAPRLLLFHLFSFLFLIYQSITWFILTPKAVVVRIGEDRVPDHLVIGANVGPWLVITAVFIWAMS